MRERPSSEWHVIFQPFPGVTPAQKEADSSTPLLLYKLGVQEAESLPGSPVEEATPSPWPLCAHACLRSLSVLVTFHRTVTKHLTKKRQFKGETVCCDSQSEGDILSGKAPQQEQEANGHNVSEVRKQRETNAPSSIVSSLPRTAAHRMMAHFWGGSSCHN